MTELSVKTVTFIFCDKKRKIYQGIFAFQVLTKAKHGAVHYLKQDAVKRWCSKQNQPNIYLSRQPSNNLVLVYDIKGMEGSFS